MNRDKILELADTIERAAIPGLGFNMGQLFGKADNPFFDAGDRTGRDCGTTACIAGWAVVVGTGRTIEDIRDEMEDLDYFDLDEDARELLGLDQDQAYRLFFSGPRDVSFGDITPAMAVATLRHLAETGEVDWDVGYGASQRFGWAPGDVTVTLSTDTDD